MNDIYVSGCTLDEVSHLIKHVSKGKVRLVAQAPRSLSWKGTGSKDLLLSSPSPTSGSGEEASQTVPDGGKTSSSPVLPEHPEVKLRRKDGQKRSSSRERPLSEILQTNNDLIDKESRAKMKKKSSVKAKLGRVFGHHSTKNRASLTISLPLERDQDWRAACTVREEPDPDEMVDLSENTHDKGQRYSREALSNEKQVQPDSGELERTITEKVVSPVPVLGEDKESKEKSASSRPKPVESSSSPVLLSPVLTEPRSGSTSSRDTLKGSMSDRSSLAEEPGTERTVSVSQKTKIKRRRRSIDMEPPPPPPPPPQEDGDGDDPQHPISQCVTYPRTLMNVPDGQECPLRNSKQQPKVGQNIASPNQKMTNSDAPSEDSFLSQVLKATQFSGDYVTLEDNECKDTLVRSPTSPLSPKSPESTRPNVSSKPVVSPKPLVSPTSDVSQTPRNSNQLSPASPLEALNRGYQKSEDDEEVFTDVSPTVAKDCVILMNGAPDPLHESFGKRQTSLPDQLIPVKRAEEKQRSKTTNQSQENDDEGIFSIQVLNNVCSF